MQQEYTAVIKQDGGWWIGWIEEIPGVNCQEASREELIETLRVTLKEALELNRQEARGAAGEGFFRPRFERSLWRPHLLPELAN